MCNPSELDENILKLVSFYRELFFLGNSGEFLLRIAVMLSCVFITVKGSCATTSPSSLMCSYPFRLFNHLTGTN